MDKNKVIILLLFLTSLNSFSQDFNLSIQAKDTANSYSFFYNLIAYNSRTNSAVLGTSDGRISILAKQGDTIKISALGYGFSMFYATDTSHIVYMQAKVSTIATVSVKSLKTLEELKEERARLTMASNKTVTGLGVLASPITALYEAFSKRAKTQALINELEYEDSKAAILKELFRLYVVSDIVLMDEDEFEDFIYYMDIDENVLKNASEYQLANYIKNAFRDYRRLNDYYFKG
jgi:hypothetical protein